MFKLPFSNKLLKAVPLGFTYMENESVVSFGGKGQDLMKGLSNDDTLVGGSGSDTLKGFAGDDLLIGSGGRDYLYGGADNDTIHGGAGADFLYGGTGDDTFVFTPSTTTSYVADVIYDFSENDMIMIDVDWESTPRQISIQEFIDDFDVILDTLIWTGHPDGVTRTIANVGTINFDQIWFI